MNYDRRDAFARSKILSRGNHKNAFLFLQRVDIILYLSQFYTEMIFAGESRTRVSTIRVICIKYYYYIIWYCETSFDGIANSMGYTLVNNIILIVFSVHPSRIHTAALSVCRRV